MSDIQATATRSGKWWTIRFTNEAGDRFTQSRRLDQAEMMIRDICDMDEVTVDSITVTPITDKQTEELIARWRKASDQSAKAAKEAAAASREAAEALRAENMTIRDIASLMQVTPQRVSQLTA